MEDSPPWAFSPCYVDCLEQTQTKQHCSTQHPAKRARFSGGTTHKQNSKKYWHFFYRAAELLIKKVSPIRKGCGSTLQDRFGRGAPIRRTKKIGVITGALGRTELLLFCLPCEQTCQHPGRYECLLRTGAVGRDLDE